MDSKDNDGRTALYYAQQFKNFSFVRNMSKKVLPSFYIKHAHTKRFVGPKDANNSQLTLHEFNPKTSTLVEKQNPFLFRFVEDQLQHVQSGKYAHPIRGRKGPGVCIDLYEDSDGERTSCYLFDYDPTRCLLAGGDNYFVQVNDNRELEWQQFWGSKDENNPFDSENGFEFKIIQATVSSQL